MQDNSVSYLAFYFIILHETVLAEMEVIIITDHIHKINQLRLELDYIERQIFMRKASPVEYERLRVIHKLLRKLTK